MTRRHWPRIVRGVLGRFLIYGAILPLAFYVLFPELPAAWSLWRAGALTEALPPAQGAPVPSSPPVREEIAQAAPSRRDAARDEGRRYLAMTLIGGLDQCRRADLLLRKLCDGANYASRKTPAFMGTICGNLPDLATLIARAHATYRQEFPSQVVNAALELSRESFEHQFAGPLRHEFTGSEVEDLYRIVRGGRCEAVMDPEVARRMQANRADGKD